MYGNDGYRNIYEIFTKYDYRCVGGWFYGEDGERGDWERRYSIVCGGTVGLYICAVYMAKGTCSDVGRCGTGLIYARVGEEVESMEER